jgi:hypothetical protein
MKSETRRLNKLKDTSRNLAKRYKLSEAALRIIEKAGKIHGQQSRAIPYSRQLSFRNRIMQDETIVEWGPCCFCGLPIREGDKDHDHESSNSSQYDLSGSQPGTPAADIAIRAGVPSN